MARADRRPERPDGYRPAALRPLRSTANAAWLPSAVVLAGSRSISFIGSRAVRWGKAMLAVRDSETAARAIGFNPVLVKTAAFAPLGAVHRASPAACSRRS